MIIHRVLMGSPPCMQDTADERVKCETTWKQKGISQRRVTNLIEICVVVFFYLQMPWLMSQ